MGDIAKCHQIHMGGFAGQFRAESVIKRQHGEEGAEQDLDGADDNPPDLRQLLRHTISSGPDVVALVKTNLIDLLSHLTYQ